MSCLERYSSDALTGLNQKDYCSDAVASIRSSEDTYLLDKHYSGALV